jgi:hypothetical protein
MNVQVSYYAGRNAKIAIVFGLLLFLACFIANVYFFTTKPNIFILGTLLIALGLVTVSTFAFYAVVLQNQPLISFTLNHIQVTTGLLFKEQRIIFARIQTFTVSRWGRSYIEYKELGEVYKVPFYATFMDKDSLTSMVENIDEFQAMHSFIPNIQL